MRHMILSGALTLAILGGCTTEAVGTATGSELMSSTPASSAAKVNLMIIYSLKDGITPADFEAWVTGTDYPAMRGLSRVSDFRTYRTERLLMGEGAPSVQYIEAFAIPDLDGFVSEDMGGETVQSIMGGFMGFAEAPEFIIVSEVE